MYLHAVEIAKEPRLIELVKSSKVSPQVSLISSYNLVANSCFMKFAKFSQLNVARLSSNHEQIIFFASG